MNSRCCAERAEIAEDQHEGLIADDRVLVLQIVVEAKPFGREMLADHRHPQIGAVLAAVVPRQREAEMSGAVGATPRLCEKRLPVMARQAATLEIRARPFAAVIEEADIVVGRLERLDLRRDESVELGQVLGQGLRQIEIHDRHPARLTPEFLESLTQITGAGKSGATVTAWRR